MAARGGRTPCVKECIFRIGPEVAHSQVTVHLLLAVGGLVLEALARELLQRRLDFDVIVATLLHAVCKEIACVVVPAVNETAELADLRVIHRVLLAARA